MNKTKIERKLRRKTNPDLVKTIISAKKNEKWLEVSNLISTPRKKQVALNLDEINNAVKDNETVIVPGKVLSMGEIDKKIKIVALSFSEVAKQKLKKMKVEISFIDEEIKKNPEAKNIHILRKTN
ncbi:MAG: 50S ribosomal protein L18e [Candidatus Pacearchaeota archaeon]|jgi:large subunit ribosomal protein L18e